MDNEEHGRGNGLRDLPSVGELLADPDIQRAADGMAREYVVQIARAVMQERRAQFREMQSPIDRDGMIAAMCARLMQQQRPKLRRVINGTGVILHTNLGRAPMSESAVAAMWEAAAAYVPLEMDLASGNRGGRMAEIERLFNLLTGCDAALVVNNNAAATMLVLAAVVSPARNAVVLSRAEAVEIGGSFRIPDILRQSGATLVDVGTTNRTYLRDYADAMTAKTAAFLKVHSSNFRVTGFVHETSVGELVPLAAASGIAVIDDLGSGALVDTTAYGLAREPTLQGSVAAGAHLTCASGDKLLGGPQAGIILGQRAWVAKCAAHPFARAVRADKTTLAGLAATLRHYLRQDYSEHIPIWRMIATSPEVLRGRVEDWVRQLRGNGVPVAVTASLATIGGGSLPGETLPSFALTIREQDARADGHSIDALAAALRMGTPPLVARIDQGRLWIDARTVFPADDADVVRAVGAAWRAM